jgi:hypothetical protein
MSLDPRKWHKCDETLSYQLTACTVYPSHVYELPLDVLPENMRTGMPGLSAAFVSGYCTTSAFESFTAAGEFAVAASPNIFLYYSAQPHGPFSLEGVRTMCLESAVPDDAYFWKDGLPDWLPISSLDSIFT